MAFIYIQKKRGTINIICKSTSNRRNPLKVKMEGREGEKKGKREKKEENIKRLYSQTFFFLEKFLFCTSMYLNAGQKICAVSIQSYRYDLKIEN
jgi:hypothetical protein